MTELELLQAENERLQNELAQLKKEHETVVRTIIKALKALDLWPITADDNLAKKAIKAGGAIMRDSLINPDALSKRFDFFEDIFPLAEKYKDFQID